MEIVKLKSSYDELEIELMYVAAEGVAKGTVQLVHGMCEHKERYRAFMEFLVANGYNCIIHDHRGHGASVKSEEDLGYMYSGGWKALVSDIGTVMEYAREKFPGSPVKLLGHSMGSLAVRSFAKRHDELIDTLIVVGSPADNPMTGVGKLLADAVALVCGGHSRPKFLHALVLGSFNKAFEDEGWPCGWVCSDKQILEEYHSDPLCTFRFTANGFSGLLGLMKDCYNPKGWKLANKALPVHFLSGAEDPCGGCSAKSMQHCVDVMKKAGYESVDMKLYTGMRHEILNEIGKEIVWNDILELL